MQLFTSISEKIRPHFNEGVKIVLFFFLVAAAVIFAVHSFLSAAYIYPLDYGEAPLVDQAMRLALGENIYRADLSTPPYNITNYPPLYMISIIPFLEWLETPFQMGRIISILATLLSSVFIALTIHTFTRDRLSSVVAALFFLASPYVVQWSGRARIDSLALAFATAALFVLVRWPRSRWAWLGGGLLLVAAAYTRQSYLLAAPLAAFVWLWADNKRRAIELALLVGGLALALFFLINTLTGGGFYYNIVTANVNEFGMERLMDNLKRLWEDNYLILLLGVLFLAIGWRSQKSWALLAPFLVGAFVSSLTIGKIGSNINYFLELSAALALVAGILVFWSGQYPWRNAAVVLLVAAQFGILMRASMLNNVDRILAPRYLDFSYLQALEQEVKDMQGTVLSDEYMGLLTMNDRPLYLQPFEVTQLAEAGVWDQGPVLEQIASHDFEAILIHHFAGFSVYRERWTPEMLAAIDTYYRPVKTLAGTVIYKPLQENTISPAPAPSRKASGPVMPTWDAQPDPVGAASFVTEPFIALDPTDSDQLVAVFTRTSKQECELPNCKVELIFFESHDGGASWQQGAVYGQPQRVMYRGLAAFAPSGLLYLMGLRNDEVVLQSTTLADGAWPPASGFEPVTRAWVQARPWLRIHPETGELFLSMDTQEESRAFATPGLIRSDDGLRWTQIARADQHVSTTDISASRTLGLEDVQVLFGSGEQVSLVWVWEPDPLNWPRTVWMANSTDGGVTFSEPASILETWGPINTASSNGTYAIAYRTGSEKEQQLAVAVTTDQGQSWTSTIASGSVPLSFDPAKGPGISMSSTGIIDLVFYALEPGSKDCAVSLGDWEWMRWTGRVDPCTYNVYYTYSLPGDLTFSEPLLLNLQSIRGEDFIRYQGGSQAGSHLAVVSGDGFAVPVWVGTPEQAKTQVYTARIER